MTSEQRDAETAAATKTSTRKRWRHDMGVLLRSVVGAVNRGSKYYAPSTGRAVGPMAWWASLRCIVCGRRGRVVHALE